MSVRPIVLFLSVQLVMMLATTWRPVDGYRLNSKHIDTPPFPEQHQRLVDANSGHPVATASVGYVKASIPVRIFQCMQQASILRCLKLFMLQRMQRTDGQFANSGNITADFLDQLLRDDGQDADDAAELVKVGEGVADEELNERLLQTFRRFFRNREIKLYFVPGMVVKVVPSTQNFLHFSVRKAKSLPVSGEARNKDLEVVDDDVVKDDGLGGGLGGGGGGLKKNNYKTTEYLLQLGVPALMMPAILLGTVLPFLLPALKMATILTTLINNGALMTAAMYAAKQAAFPSERIYYNAGYHREFEQF